MPFLKGIGYIEGGEGATTFVFLLVFPLNDKSYRNQMLN